MVTHLDRALAAFRGSLVSDGYDYKAITNLITDDNFRHLIDRHIFDATAKRPLLEISPSRQLPDSVIQQLALAILLNRLPATMDQLVASSDSQVSRDQILGLLTELEHQGRVCQNKLTGHWVRR